MGALFYDFSLEEVDHEENSKTASKERRSVLLAKISANKSRNRKVNESDASGEFWSISGSPDQIRSPNWSEIFVGPCPILDFQKVSLLVRFETQSLDPTLIIIMECSGLFFSKNLKWLKNWRGEG